MRRGSDRKEDGSLHKARKAAGVGTWDVSTLVAGEPKSRSGEAHQSQGSARRTGQQMKAVRRSCAALYIGDVSPSLLSGGTSAPNEERKAVVGSLKGEFQRRAASPQTVSAQCTETEVIVTINPDLLGIGKPVQASDLTIGGCGVTRQVATPAAFVIDAPLHGCGSTVKTFPDDIVYEFILEYKPTAIPGLPIMRTNAAVIKIECHYARHHNVSSHAFNPTWIPYTSTQDFPELLDFSLLVMNSKILVWHFPIASDLFSLLKLDDKCTMLTNISAGDWSGPRPSYTFYLGDLINLQASMDNSSHVPLRLFVDSCVGTDASAQSYTFIGNNGCIIDGKLSDSGSQFVIPRISPSVLRFTLDVFKFYGTGNNSIFITCQLKATFASQNVDALNKACSYNPGLNQLRHSLGALSVVSVYAPTSVSDISVREAFYSQLCSVVDECPQGNTPLVMGDFNAATGTDRAGYEDCLSPHGSGDRGESGSMFLDFAKGQGLRIAGFWFQRPEPHRWTWYSNTGGAVKEIDHILLGRGWRLLQNCRVYRNAQFVSSDHRLVVATLRIQLRSSRLPPARKMSLNLDRLQDKAVSNEFA
ncbi:ZP3 protein, partial [Polypterus senegalus]